MASITQADIVAGLRELGVGAGDQLLVHSSLSSFGHVEGGADTVIDALLEAVSPESGTVVFPTLTGYEALSAENPPYFHPVESACWTGTIPETARQRREAIRSLHPTHSVAAIGADADALTRSHINSITPGDENSPYLKLASQPDGYILLIGVTHASNTTFHSIEELVGVPYHIRPGFVAATIVQDGQETTRHTMLHAYGTPRNFNRMEPVFIERDIQRNGKIGAAEIRLVHSGRMVDCTLQALRVDPTILLASDG